MKYLSTKTLKKRTMKRKNGLEASDKSAVAVGWFYGRPILPSAKVRETDGRTDGRVVK